MQLKTLKPVVQITHTAREQKLFKKWGKVYYVSQPLRTMYINKDYLYVGKLLRPASTSQIILAPSRP